MKCWTAGLSRRSRIGEVVRLIDQRIEIDDSREKRPIDPKTKIVDPDVFECELHGRNGRYLSSAKISALFEGGSHALAFQQLNHSDRRTHTGIP